MGLHFHASPAPPPSVHRGQGRARRSWATSLLAALIVTLGLTNTSLAAELSIRVTGTTGAAVADVVITVTPQDTATSRPAAGSKPSPTATMDQRHRAFVPRVLVVAAGTRVAFPNGDTVSHQVYSFSAAKKFQLPLYKGMTHEQVTFELPGLVVLGCNIHDEMVGYIYVTDAPHFGQTDATGVLRLGELPPGTYQVQLWSPVIADAADTMTRRVTVQNASPTQLEVALQRPLRARPEPRPKSAAWDY
jgi:plastocyanin